MVLASRLMPPAGAENVLTPVVGMLGLVSVPRQELEGALAVAGQMLTVYVGSDPEGPAESSICTAVST